ncbi:hypothetical protein K402DRAFT_307182, partial [Aulographum hederae CBS 113979]
ATLSGSKQFDVYTALAPADADAATWPSGNLRDNHVARMEAQVGGEAKPLAGFPNGLSFPCPAGRTLGGELVGVNDKVEVGWSAARSG